MNFTTEILTYLRSQYENATGKTMVSDSTMHSAQAPFYFRDLADNLIEPMSAGAEKAYKNGDGNELDEKMRALRSSSAMTFNLLGNETIEVRSDSTFFMPGQYSISYEKQISTIKHNPHKANLDAFLEGDRQLIFCEMKMTEWLFNQPGVLRESYLNKGLYWYSEIYDAVMECLKQICSPNPTDYKTYYSKLQTYDAFQMLKHTLAIYNYAMDHREEIPKNIRLVNCVWHLPEDALLSKEATAEYLQKEQTEHREFEQFHASVEAIIQCFANQGIDFDILFMPAETFAEQFVKTPEQQKYLKRYFGEHGKCSTRDDFLLQKSSAKVVQKTAESRMNFIDRLRLRRKEGNFYRSKELKYTGKSDDGRYYTEVIAEMLYQEYYPDSPNLLDLSEQRTPLSELLLNGAVFQEEKEFAPSPIHWENGHKVKQVYNPNSNRNEDNIAKRLFEQNPLIIENFVETQVIDYQVPVNRADGTGEGKVDLKKSFNTFPPFMKHPTVFRHNPSHSEIAYCPQP